MTFILESGERGAYCLPARVVAVFSVCCFMIALDVDAWGCDGLCHYGSDARGAACVQCGRCLVGSVRPCYSRSSYLLEIDRHGIPPFFRDPWTATLTTSILVFGPYHHATTFSLPCPFARFGTLRWCIQFGTSLSFEW